ncbi:hypothetical protein JTE90_003354 [Oedothorax gibbosus]|uniref:Phlebovirus glycoprotein G2 fusion domain-containing protein n=1 Tax=Oedothorax gibbosus TaxID=931172 RepID=A0AAV6TXZ7_9ARAC|nr:hypothetical protein JTE90_003354 [Oedothorax gibbosus]
MTVVAATKPRWCKRRENSSYFCEPVPTEVLESLPLPDNACAILSCKDCVVANATFIVKNQEELLHATTFLDRPTERQGNRTDYECFLSRDGRGDSIPIKCDCASNCTGSSEFCNNFKCDATASCECVTKKVLYELSHIASTPSVIYPTILSLPVCIFRKTPIRKTRRQLLEFENAIFSLNSLNLTFHDPVVTVPTSGKLIARASGKEVVFDVKEDFNVVLPLELLAFKDKLKLIFISTSGRAVYGEVLLEGKTICSSANCVFCRDFLRQVKCWPAHLAYMLYLSLVIMGSITIIFVSFAVKGALTLCSVGLFTVGITYRCIKASLRLFMLSGAVFGNSIRRKFQNFHDYLEVQNPRRAANVAIILFLGLIAMAADLLKSYEVRTITGHECSYTIAVTRQHNDTQELLNIQTSDTTVDGIHLQVLGSYNQPQLHLNDKLVLRVGDYAEAYLSTASPPNRPTSGLVGQIQANLSYTKEFIFDRDMVNCDFFETQLRCTNKPDVLQSLYTSKEQALPLTRDLHLMTVDKGKLVSKILSTAPVRVQMHFSNYKVSVQTVDVCPKISDTDITTKGCYAYSKNELNESASPLITLPPCVNTKAIPLVISDCLCLPPVDHDCTFPRFKDGATYSSIHGITKISDLLETTLLTHPYILGDDTVHADHMNSFQRMFNQFADHDNCYTTTFRNLIPSTKPEEFLNLTCPDFPNSLITPPCYQDPRNFSVKQGFKEILKYNDIDRTQFVRIDMTPGKKTIEGKQRYLHNFTIQDFSNYAIRLKIGELETDEDGYSTIHLHNDAPPTAKFIKWTLDRVNTQSREPISRLWTDIFRPYASSESHTCQEKNTPSDAASGDSPVVYYKQQGQDGQLKEDFQIVRLNNKCSRNLHDTDLALKELKSKILVPPGFDKSIFTTLVWDNNDFGEETLTGAGTTHNTNFSLLQWESQETTLEPEISFEMCKKSRKRTLDSTSTYVVPYKLVKRAGPINLTPNHNTEKDQLLMCKEFYRKQMQAFIQQNYRRNRNCQD